MYLLTHFFRIQTTKYLKKSRHFSLWYTKRLPFVPYIPISSGSLTLETGTVVLNEIQIIRKCEKEFKIVKTL
jgi:hypothetical protein